MAEEPAKVHVSPEDQKETNITGNESVQRVPLQCLREITWKLPQLWSEAAARGINGNSSVFKSYFIYQQQKTRGVLAVFGHEVRSCPTNVLLHPSLCLAEAFLTAHGDQRAVRLPPSSLVFLFVKGTINNEGRALGISFVIQLVTFVVTGSKKCKTLWRFLCKWINSSCCFMDILA